MNSQQPPWSPSKSDPDLKPKSTSSQSITSSKSSEPEPAFSFPLKNFHSNLHSGGSFHPSKSFSSSKSSSFSSSTRRDLAIYDKSHRRIQARPDPQSTKESALASFFKPNSPFGTSSSGGRIRSSSFSSPSSSKSTSYSRFHKESSPLNFSSSSSNPFPLSSSGSSKSPLNTKYLFNFRMDSKQKKNPKVSDDVLICTKMAQLGWSNPYVPTSSLRSHFDSDQKMSSPKSKSPTGSNRSSTDSDKTDRDKETNTAWCSLNSVIDRIFNENFD